MLKVLKTAYFLFCLMLSLIFACDSDNQKETQIVINEKIAPKSRQIAAIVTTEKIKYGETLSAILKKHNFDSQLSYNISSSFQTIFNVKHLKPKQSYRIEKDPSGNFIRFIYQPTVEKQYIVCKDDSGNIKAKINKIPLEKKINSIKGEIKTNLYDAIMELGETPELLIAISDIFQWDIDFFIDPRKGDNFKIIYVSYLLPQDSTSLKPDKERFVRYGKTLAAQYILQGQKLTAVYFDNAPDDDGYYALNGESFQKTFLKSPLNYRRISSYFSYGRRHPILKKIRPHYGIDFAAPTGTPVSAAADGIIIEKGYNRGYGNFLKIKHKNPRFVTLYGHLSRFARSIKEGTPVKQKDVIGYVGKTGLATGPHLHYTFYEHGKPINPLKIKNTSGDPISEENIAKFNSVKKEMIAYFDDLENVEFPLVHNLAMMVHLNRYLITER